MVLVNFLSACRRMQVNPCLSPTGKLQSNCIKNLKIKPDNLNLIEEKVGQDE